MTAQLETKTRDIFQEFPNQKYNPLIPVQSFTQLSPFHKLAVNVVRLSTDPGDKDIYPERNGEYAITKKGLMTLMAAANIQAIAAHAVSPSGCRRCMNIAKQTRIPPNCSECPKRNDVAWEVVLSIPNLSGGHRRVMASREFICKDEWEKISQSAQTEKSAKAQYRMAFNFRSALTETKALNRALREALMLRGTYPLKELEKPFAVPIVILDMENPEIRQAVLKRYERGIEILSVESPAFPEEDSFAENMEQEMLPSSVPSSDEADRQMAAIEEAKETVIFCEDCGVPITPAKALNGKDYSVEKILVMGQKASGKNLCVACLRGIRENRNARGEQKCG